jgi:hypothetical protein
MQLLFLSPNCPPKTISAEYLKIREAWEEFKPIILITVQHSCRRVKRGKTDLSDGNRMDCIGW